MFDKETWVNLKIYDVHRLEDKSLEFMYFPIPQKVKATRK